MSPKNVKHEANKEKLKFKLEINKILKKGDKLYPDMCADLCARHTANILQKGNPHKVRIKILEEA